MEKKIGRIHWTNCALKLWLGKYPYHLLADSAWCVRPRGVRLKSVPAESCNKANKNDIAKGPRSRPIIIYHWAHTAETVVSVT